MEITAVHMAGVPSHEHIMSVRWQNHQDSATGTSSREEMVAFIRGAGRAYVADGTRAVEVGVVEHNPPYIRTHADDVWTDNLLALPRF